MERARGKAWHNQKYLYFPPNKYRRHQVPCTALEKAASVPRGPLFTNQVSLRASRGCLCVRTPRAPGARGPAASQSPASAAPAPPRSASRFSPPPPRFRRPRSGTRGPRSSPFRGPRAVYRSRRAPPLQPLAPRAAPPGPARNPTTSQRCSRFSSVDRASPSPGVPSASLPALPRARTDTSCGDRFPGAGLAVLPAARAGEDRLTIDKLLLECAFRQALRERGYLFGALARARALSLQKNWIFTSPHQGAQTPSSDEMNRKPIAGLEVGER